MKSNNLLDEDANILAVFSFGAFILEADETGVQYYSFEERKLHVEIISYLMVGAIIISLLYLIWMRRAILKYALEMDQESYTPSDFCLMGSNMYFDSYDPQDME